MPMIVNASACFLPNLSPMCPKTTPPSGRMKNATPKTIRLDSSAVVGFSSEKKTLASTVAV